MITTSRAALLSAAERCAKIAPTKSNQPILSHVAIECDGERLSYRATSLMMALAGSIGCKGQGAFTVNARDLVGALSSLVGEPLKIDLKDGQVKLQADGKRSFRFKAMPIDEYPEAPKPPVGNGEIDAAALATVIEATHFSVADDVDNRDYLKILSIRSDGKTILAEATNGHRACRASVEHVGQKFALQLPIGAPRAVLDFAATGAVTLAQDGRFIQLSRDGESLIIQKLAASFPDVDGVFNNSARHSVVVETDRLLDVIAAVRQADAEGDLILAFGQALRVSASNQESEAFDEIDVACPGESKLAISAKYLSEALKACASDKVTIGYPGTDELDPVHITAGNWHGIILPMRPEVIRAKGKM